MLLGNTVSHSAALYLQGNGARVKAGGAQFTTLHHKTRTFLGDSPMSTTQTVEINELSLRNYLKLASRGQHPFASGGEKRSYRLAACVYDNVPGLDQTAVEGLYEFLRIAAAKPSLAAKLARLDGLELE
jgi:hypothetical protein